MPQAGIRTAPLALNSSAGDVTRLNEVSSAALAAANGDNISQRINARPRRQTLAVS
jgi:hypothetical protein